MSFASLDIERLELFKSLGFTPECIYDIGASNGNWTKQVAKVFPDAQFHLFEPLAKIAAPYMQGLEELSHTSINSTLHPFALGDKSGVTHIGVSDHLVGSSLLVERTTSRFPTVEEIQVMTVDEVVEIFSLPVPQLIKIDTQGYEFEILKGATKTLQQVEMLLLETWLIRGYGAKTPLLFELTEWLARHNFFLLDLSDHYRNGAGILYSQDFFFIRQPCAIQQLNQDRIFSLNSLSPEEHHEELTQLEEGFRNAHKQLQILGRREQRLQEKIKSLKKSNRQAQHQLRLEIKSLKKSNRQTQRQLKLSEDQIAEMENSKFWKLRTIYASLKRALDWNNSR